MSILHDPRIEARVEALCQKGCRHVWADIEALEKGRDLPETNGLPPGDRAELLEELKSIMSVYSDRCSAA